MKKNVHPAYDWVVIEDASSDFRILTRSTVKSNQKTTWTDGKEYPLVTVEVSSASHPFYTGKQKIMDTGGRIDRFNKKYGKAKVQG
jgi:large subunit ribosomal protein L31